VAPSKENEKSAYGEAKCRRWRWQVFAVTWLAYVGYYLTRKSFSVAKIDLADPTGVSWSKSELASVDGAFLVAYAVGQFIWGPLGDRFGTRNLVLAGMGCSIMTALLMGASQSLLWFGIFFTLQGLCQSTGWAPLTRNLGQFFERHERGRIVGLWCTNYAVGGFVAVMLAGWAAHQWDWRYAFWIPAAGLLVIMVGFYLFQVNEPEDVGLRAVSDSDAATVGQTDQSLPSPFRWELIWRVVTNPMVLLLGLVYFLLKPMRYLAMFWSPVYVHERLGTDAATSGMLGSLFDFSGPVALFAGGWISDKVFASRRVPVMVICLVLAGVLVLCFHQLPANRVWLGVGFFLLGFLLYIPDSMASATAAIDFGSPSGASTAAGFINGCGSAGAIVGGTIPGWVQALAGPNQDAWWLIFTSLGLALLLAAGILLPQWNRLPRAASEPASRATTAGITQPATI
jgi:OPA family sugar phosphate sensor protein UhpC-like MFS transporter